MPPAAEIEAALRERLQATHVVRGRPVAVALLAPRRVQRPTRNPDNARTAPQAVVDVSDGCGSKFEVEIESPQFEGKALLARHRLVRCVGSATACSVVVLALTAVARPPGE
jgi:stress-induced morphogen